jgi:hypothetical protein
MIWNRITEFYDDLFQYHYEKQKKFGSDPEVFPISMISFCQGTNFLILLIAIYFMTDLSTLVGKTFIPYSIFVLYIIFGGINFYRYTIKNGTDKIIKRNKTIDKKMKWYSNIYLLVSIWFPLFLIYFFNEIY